MGRSFFRKLLDDDSDEDEIITKLLTGSTSQRRHRRYIDRNHLAGHRRLYDDYFAEEPVYPPNLFRRRFRMRRSLFLRILSKVEAHEPYFTQKRNAAKKLGLSPLQKMTAALRMLAYGVAADFMDEYVRIAETTAITSLKKFVAAVVAIFSEEYLRSPNNEDIARFFISMCRSFFRKLLDDDSDEDEIITKLLTGSTSQRRHRRYIDRNHLVGHRRLYDDYFAEEPVYPPNLFRKRFRMRRSLFLRILSKVETHEPYFTKKRNAAKKLGLSPLQKMTAALRMLTYGVAADFMDEYVRIAETTAITSLKKFVATVVAIFSEEYLRSPNNEDIARLLAHGQNRGFPGMLGSIDCMHWKWKNCPTAWKGMYCGHIREPSIILEAVASYDLWI
ncbi:uncharacterized protein LOC112037137 [Quercus suber]|uniref:uncharacterized protein LOC112037137 n=1 Tax=Quercus suber TaxID=58331 RepID=UPI0032DE81AA